MAKRVHHLSPKGNSKFLFLHEPSTKFDPDGEFQATLLLKKGDEETAKFLKFLDEQAEANRQEMAKEKKKPAILKYTLHTGYKPDTQKDAEGNEQETDFIAIKFKSKAKGEYQGKTFTRSVGVFDAFGNPIPASIRPGGGSIIRVSFTVRPCLVEASRLAGNSLSLEGVQVVKLVKAGGPKSAEQYGFTPDEEGYSVEEDIPATETEGDGGADAPATAPKDDF